MNKKAIMLLNLVIQFILTATGTMLLAVICFLVVT